MTPPNYLYDEVCVIFSTHSVVRIYDTPNYLYDKGCHIFYSFCG